jgi:two-component system sensor histidine kinase KdpD
MLHGNIYPKEKVPQALTHFFRTDNLIALRELALRFVADESDEELLEHLQRRHSPVPWETTERIMVAVTTAPGTDVLMRRAARIALRFKGELDVVHVAVSHATRPEDARSVDQLRELAADLGARWHRIEDDDPAKAVVSFAREHQITQIVIGSIQHSWWHIPGGGPIFRQVVHEAGASGIDVHLIARREPPAATASSAVGPPKVSQLAPDGPDKGHQKWDRSIQPVDHDRRTDGVLPRQHALDVTPRRAAGSVAARQCVLA